MSYREIFNEIRRWHHELRRTLSKPEIVRAMEKRIEDENDPETLDILKSALAREHIAQGNEAAAKALFRDDPTDKIHKWHRSLRRRRSDIVRAIEKRILKETEPRQLQALRGLLADEHQLRGNYASAEALLLQLFNGDDDEVLPLISLATQKLYLEKKPEAAMLLIDRAIEATYRSGLFRRYALGDKARIALELKQYSVVEDVLKQIMALSFEPANADIAVERDFFDRLPPGAIDAEVARRYEEYCQAHGRHKKPPSA